MVIDPRLKQQLDSFTEEELSVLRDQWLSRPKSVVERAHREAFADDIEDRLTWLMLAEPDRKTMYANALNHCGAISVRTLHDETKAGQSPGRAERLATTGMWTSATDLFPDIIPTDLGGVVSITSMVNGEKPGVPWNLLSVRQISRRGWTGVGPRCSHEYMAIAWSIDKFGALRLDAADHIGWGPTTSYMSLVSERYPNARRRKNARDIMVGALNALLERRYDWCVEMGFPGHPRVSFETDPTGIRFMYADREKGARQRRAALRHWVTEHWRHGRRDSADLVWVREHMRGAFEFQWNGLSCTVRPSMFDVERSLRSYAQERIHDWIGGEKAAPKAARAIIDQIAENQQIVADVVQMAIDRGLRHHVRG